MEPNPSRSVAFKTLCSSAEKPNRVVEFRTIDVPENVVAKTLAEPYLPSPTPLHPVRLHFLDVLLHLKYTGPTVIPCDATFRKGDELGWFQHGSTIIVLAPPGVSLDEHVSQGQRIKMGQALLSLGA